MTAFTQESPASEKPPAQAATPSQAAKIQEITGKQVPNLPPAISRPILPKAEQVLKAEETPSLQLKEARDLQIKLLRELDLSAIEEVTSKPNLNICSLETVTKRNQIAEQANLARSNYPISCLDKLAELLKKEGDTKGSELATALARSMESVFKEVETELKRARVPAAIKPIVTSLDKNYQELARNHGYLFDTHSLLSGNCIIPVDATISIKLGAHDVQAIVVGNGVSRGNRFAGEAKESGMIIFNTRAVAEHSPSAILANELAHVDLFLNQKLSGGDAPLEGVFSTPAPPTNLSPQIAPGVKLFLPTNAHEVHELRSDIWSTRVSLKDIDRLVDNGLRLLLDDIAISSTSTAKSYRLSAELAVIAALSADQNNGRKLKLMDRVNQITSKQAELVELANNRSKEQDPALRREARRAYWNKSDQIDDARLEFVKTLPDSYRIEIRSVLTHYANEYVNQLSLAAKNNPALRVGGPEK